MAAGSAQFDDILQTPEGEEPPPIELTGPQYVKTLAGASAPFPYFDPLQISSKVGSFLPAGRLILLAGASCLPYCVTHPPRLPTLLAPASTSGPRILNS